MGVTVSKSATAKMKLPLYVEYNCAFCGHHNRDQSQTAEIASSVGGSAFANEEKLADQAKEQLAAKSDEKIHAVAERIVEKKYRELKLTCTCEACKQQQPWANMYKSYGVRPLLCLFCILFAWGCSGNQNWLGMLAFLVAGFVPIILVMIHNKKTSNQISALPNEKKPYIMLVLSNGRKVDPKALLNHQN